MTRDRRPQLRRPRPSPWQFCLIAALALAACTRLAIIWTATGDPLSDLDNYLELSSSLAHGKGFRLAGRLTAYRPPLYPLLLAPIQALAAGNPQALQTGIFGFHLILGLGTVWLTALTARRWGLPHVHSLAAAAIVACDPVLVAQTRLVMTETLAAFLVVACLFALASSRLMRSAWQGGLTFGLAALCRPSLLAIAPLIVLAILADRSTTPLRLRWQAAATFLALTLLVMSPWAIRNRVTMGHTLWTTTHGGYTLALGNNPVYYREVLHGPPGAVFSGPGQDAWWASLSTLPASAPGDEFASDRAIRDHALKTIRDHPADFALAALDRLARLWGVWPSSAVYGRGTRVATALWTIPLWLALAYSLRLTQTWRWPGVTALAFLIGLSAVHAVFWTDLRMRAPIVPAIALLAASTPGHKRSDSS